MKHTKAIVDAAVRFVVVNGLSCREAAAQLERTTGIRADAKTIAAWAVRFGGVSFKGRQRYRPCQYCGSHAKHKKNCPIFKEHNA